MRNKNKLYYRAWLNAKEGVARVEVTAEDTWVRLGIGDCSRSIGLDFYCGDSKSKRASKVKLNRLRYALDLVEKYLDEAR